ncbi:MAG: helix-turn-helix domain-containing protein, partial [Verrucomicrobiota bacterium]
WPGNVRELENLIYRSAVIAQGDMILIKHLPLEVVKAVGDQIKLTRPPFETEDVPVSDAAVATISESISSPEIEASDDALLGAPTLNPYDAVYEDLRKNSGTNILESAERELIQRALAESGGKQVKAAEILGMTRATLRKRIDQYDLKYSRPL